MPDPIVLGFEVGLTPKQVARLLEGKDLYVRSKTGDGAYDLTVHLSPLPLEDIIVSRLMAQTALLMRAAADGTLPEPTPEPSQSEVAPGA